jgi:Spy/CpxP family protein refolding chaperone
MKKTTIGALAVVGLALFGAVGAYAAAAIEGKGEKKAYRFISAHVENMLDDVNATDAQRSQVNAVKDQLFEQGKALKTGMEGTREELKAQWLAPRMDQGRVDRLVDERIDAFRSFAHQAVAGLVKVHDTLTPEQRLQLSKEHEARAREHHW